jgi:hypothetical protein
VNRVIIESLRRLEPSSRDVTLLRQLGVKLLKRQLPIAGADDCAVIAPLLILRFGDRRSLPLLKRMLDNLDRVVAPAVVRSCAIAYSSFGLESYRAVRKSAGKLLRNHLSQTVRFLEEIRLYREVPDLYKARVYVEKMLSQAESSLTCA